MSAVYATITSKGPITLPASARRTLGLRAGQRVRVRIEDQSVVLDPPEDIAAVRAQIRRESEAAGTRGHVPTAGEGWAARATDYRAHA